MTVTKMTSSKNTMDMCYIGLSCLTQIEKKMLDNKMQIGSVSFQS